MGYMGIEYFHQFIKYIYEIWLFKCVYYALSNGPIFGVVESR